MCPRVFLGCLPGFVILPCRREPTFEVFSSDAAEAGSTVVLEALDCLGNFPLPRDGIGTGKGVTWMGMGSSAGVWQSVTVEMRLLSCRGLEEWVEDMHETCSCATIPLPSTPVAAHLRQGVI